MSNKYLSVTGRGKINFREGGGFRPTFFIDLSKKKVGINPELKALNRNDRLWCKYLCSLNVRTSLSFLLDVWYGGGPWWLPVGGIQPGPMGAGRVEGGPGPAAAL